MPPSLESEPKGSLLPEPLIFDKDMQAQTTPLEIIERNGGVRVFVFGYLGDEQAMELYLSQREAITTSGITHLIGTQFGIAEDGVSLRIVRQHVPLVEEDDGITDRTIQLENTDETVPQTTEAHEQTAMQTAAGVRRLLEANFEARVLILCDQLHAMSTEDSDLQSVASALADQGIDVVTSWAVHRDNPTNRRFVELTTADTFDQL